MAKGGIAARLGKGRSRARLTTQQRLTGSSSFDRARAGTHLRMHRTDWTQLKSDIIAQRGERCQKCGLPTSQLILDHIIPHSQGGSNSPRNLMLVCASCDKKKLGKANRRGARLLHGR